MVVGLRLAASLSTAFALRLVAMEAATKLATVAMIGFRAALALVGGPVGLAVSGRHRVDETGIRPRCRRQGRPRPCAGIERGQGRAGIDGQGGGRQQRGADADGIHLSFHPATGNRQREHLPICKKSCASVRLAGSGISFPVSARRCRMNCIAHGRLLIKANSRPQNILKPIQAGHEIS
jgi:hypothetical protein